MPIIKSAKKRVKTATKAAVRNSKTKRTLRSALRTFGAKPAGQAHSSAQSQIDKAVKKGILHKNKAARMKRQLALKAKAAGVKPTAAAKKAAVKAKSAVKPAASKKASPKKAAAKKPTAKKGPAKKPATKRAAKK